MFLDKRFISLPLLALILLFSFIACDDDSANDDAHSDDDADDDDNDAGDDDGDDDDNDDDGYPDVVLGDWLTDTETIQRGDLTMERVEGGAPGDDGISLAITPAGETLIVYVKTRFLYLLRVGDKAAPRLLAQYAYYPQLAVDDNGALHIVYYDSWNEALVYLSDASGSWTSARIAEDVDKTKPTFALDKQGCRHIAWANRHCLYYTTDRSGSWTTETLYQDENLYAYGPSLVVDGNGAAHVAYWLAPAEIEYQTNAGGTWQIQTVFYSSNYNDTVKSLALAVDAQNVAYVAFEVDISIGYPVIARYAGYWFATSTGTAWLTEKLQNEFFTEQTHHAGVALRLDENNRAHIAFDLELSESSLIKTFTNASGNWQAQVLKQNEQDRLFNVALALDGAGNDRIAALQNDSCSLLLWTKAKDGWTETIVHEDSAAGNGATIAVGETGVHLAYADDKSGNVRYANKADDQWLRETVDRQNAALTSDHTNRNTVALTGAGQARLAYLSFDDEGTAWVEYAARDDGWSSETIGMTAEGQNADLVVDGEDRPHVVYDDAQVHYAGRSGDEWETTVIPGSNGHDSLGQTLATVVDADGAVHVVFSVRRSLDTLLMYATNASGEWVAAEIPDSYLKTGTETDLAVDANGAAHIVFYEEGGVVMPSYATNAQSDWTVERISLPLALHYAYDQYPPLALALNQDGNPVLVYALNYNSSRGESILRYTIKIDSVWRDVVLDRAPTKHYYEHLDVALDDEGAVHVVCHAGQSVWHAWFPEDYEP
ncbi:MAG TPA: hypothetical protein PKW95_15045 [bacterium]|nr:hypothetical protein [bacterium]